MLRPFLWLAVFGCVVVLVIVPSAYFYTSAMLPQLDTEFDLLRSMKLSIESERKSVQMGQYQRAVDAVTFDRPDIVSIPKELVAFYITERGCPTYFQSPREEGWAWSKRVLGVFFNIEPDGDGWCEKVFADNISRRVIKWSNSEGAAGSMGTAVATHKIHRFLKKDGLVAYDLATLQIDTGLIGIEAIAKDLFHKKLSDLSLSELAELQMAIPPHSYYDQVKTCSNPNLIRQNRDILIERLAMVGLVGTDKAGIARQAPVACTLVKN